jgi:hypothetical protein
MDHIHVCDAYAAPCDDPESQLDLSLGSGCCSRHDASSLLDICLQAAAVQVMIWLPHPHLPLPRLLSLPL